jgi:Flp pilus assembly protein TadG
VGGRFARYFHDRRGAGAAEFVMILPVFFGLVFAILNLCIVLYAETTLHAATEAAARCASVNVGMGNTSTCHDQSTVSSFARGRYAGPSLASLTFTYSAPTSGTCANMQKVVGAGTYRVNAVVTSMNVNLSTQSCYP